MISGSDCYHPDQQRTNQNANRSKPNLKISSTNKPHAAHQTSLAQEGRTGGFKYTGGGAGQVIRLVERGKTQAVRVLSCS